MKKTNLFRTFIIMLPKLAKVFPRTFAMWQILCVIQGVCIGIMAPITQIFFDRAAGFATHTLGIKPLAMAFLALGSVHIGRNIINGITNFTSMMYCNKAEGFLSLELHEKISKLSPALFESTEMLDTINKAMEGKSEAIRFTGSILNTLTFHLSYFTIMSLYLIKVNPILIISLFLIFTPTLLAQLLRAKFFAKAENASAPLRRAYSYYENCIISREYFKETRILGAFPYFRELFGASLTKLNRLTFKAAIKSDLVHLGVQLLSLLGYAAILLLLVTSVLKGNISVGAFAAIFSSVDMMFRIMKQLIEKNMSSVARGLGKVRFYLDFLTFQERGGTYVENEKSFDIGLKNVCFSYPGSKTNALDNITFTIKNGETIAIVGENGSGKSTLVRIIAGLYIPNIGDVLHGEANTKTTSEQSLFKNISAVFQKYQRYQMSLGENIVISDIRAKSSDIELNSICEMLGINKNDSCYPNGYDTMLSREFGGVDLSGGQWQRIALARGIFRNNTFIILDEPTAAIDPVEETNLYNRFATIAKDKTAVIVTHRVGSAKLANRILVMKDGKLCEHGEHRELLPQNGEYARLYKAQEQWYKS